MDAQTHAEISAGGQGGDAVFSVSTSRGFTDWLRQHRLSLAVSTYQVGKLFFFGVRPDGRLWIFNRNLGRCLGLAVTGEDMWVAGDSQILKFVNAMAPGETSTEGHDALYVPQAAYFTGDVDAHDLAIAGDGLPVFANTLFNGLSRPSTVKSFELLWQPKFISRTTAEDRCHLNGVALRDGKPAFATVVALSDTFDGWRDRRKDGGAVIDVATGETVCAGLSMPHSPRWHEGRLWLHNSGTGEFGFVDPARSRFEPVAFCPGYLRGLDFAGGCAIAGLSRPRGNRTFSGLALDAALEERNVEPRCGAYVIDLASGAIVHSLTIEGVVQELYDIAVLPGKQQPAIVAPGSPEARRMISL
ncbi:TIGR03032 family protein [Aestuariivirga sp.]|uniref:TIGR03032 family protein n=1 Tax=Aestuariivirga sp. TaxID=2650926 RepID=UPI0039196770